MLAISDYQDMDAIALAAGVRRQDFTCEEITTCAIAQAEKLNPSINAIVAECYESAKALSKSFDTHPDLLNKSRLAGLPFLIKDLSMVKGMPAGFGSRLFAGHIAPRNANIVQKYLDAGLVVIGTSNTPEKGLTITTEPLAYGICRNPWNTGHSTGGSSGGAAAAVAAGILPVAHATDGGGSIRIPASCCGLFGLKPSRGLTAIENRLFESWSGLSVGHVVSQTVRDSAAFLDLITIDTPNLYAMPPSPASFYAEHSKQPGQLRIAVQLDQPLDQPIDADCLSAVNQAARLCESLGHSVEEVTHPVAYQPVIAAMARIINIHVYQAFAPRLEELNLSLADSPLEASAKLMAQNGSEQTATTYLEARELIKDAERQMARFHRDYDIILSPVLSKTPVKIGWLNMNSDDMQQYTKRFKAYSGFTALYNGTGQPSMSMPLHLSADGLPVGVMFTGAWGSDSLLLRLATQLEEAAPWPRTAEV
ncbi:MAG: amidase [Proteobacteria bacterium]|nr:amidase [Pseudomonadota bacterium]